MPKAKQEEVKVNPQFYWCFESKNRYLIHIGGTRCISEDTLVKTKDGYINAKEVNENTLIDTGKGYKKPKRIYKSKTDKKKYRLTLKSGEVIECTDDHEFFTENGGTFSLKLLLDLWYGNMEENTKL